MLLLYYLSHVAYDVYIELNLIAGMKSSNHRYTRKDIIIVINDRGQSDTENTDRKIPNTNAVLCVTKHPKLHAVPPNIILF